MPGRISSSRRYSAVVAMRTAAQQVTNRTSLRLLKRSWQAHNVCIESLAVPFGAGDAPLSWHLTEREKQAIRRAWAEVAVRQRKTVEAFLSKGSAPCST